MLSISSGGNLAVVAGSSDRSVRRQSLSCRMVSEREGVRPWSVLKFDKVNRLM